MTETFDECAIVELFGHNVIAGRVSEHVIGGQGFVRVDVPETEGQEKYTKFFGPGAIYAITPCNEDTMKLAAENLRARPVDPWTLRLPQLSADVAGVPQEASDHADDADDDADDDAPDHDSHDNDPAF